MRSELDPHNNLSQLTTSMASSAMDIKQIIYYPEHCCEGPAGEMWSCGWCPVDCGCKAGGPRGYCRHSDTLLERGTLRMSLSGVSQGLCAVLHVLAMKMNLSHSALEWIYWEKEPLCVSLQWALPGCHCWGSTLGQREGPPGITHGLTRPVCPMAAREGWRDVGEQCLEASPFLLSIPAGIGECWNHQSAVRWCAVHGVAEMGRVYASDWESPNCSCINEKTENNFHAFIDCKTSYGIDCSLTFLKWKFHLNSS